MGCSLPPEGDPAAPAELICELIEGVPELRIEFHRGQHVRKRVGVMMVDTTLGHDGVWGECLDHRDDELRHRAPIRIVAAKGR